MIYFFIYEYMLLLKVLKPNYLKNQASLITFLTKYSAFNATLYNPFNLYYPFLTNNIILHCYIILEQIKRSLDH